MYLWDFDFFHCLGSGSQTFCEIFVVYKFRIFHIPPNHFIFCWHFGKSCLILKYLFISFLSWRKESIFCCHSNKGIGKHFILIGRNNFTWIVLYLPWMTYTLSLYPSKFKNTSDTIFRSLSWNSPLMTLISPNGKYLSNALVFLLVKYKLF